MKKPELIEAIAEETGITKVKAEEVLNELGHIATEALCNGRSVTLPGLGKLEVTQRAARTGRNPQTGGEVQIPARRAVKFKPMKALKDALND